MKINQGEWKIVKRARMFNWNQEKKGCWRSGDFVIRQMEERADFRLSDKDGFVGAFNSLNAAKRAATRIHKAEP